MQSSTISSEPSLSYEPRPTVNDLIKYIKSIKNALPLLDKFTQITDDMEMQLDTNREHMEMFLSANEIVKKLEFERDEYKIRIERMKAEIEHEFE